MSHPLGRELGLLNVILAKQFLHKYLPMDVVVLSVRGVGKES